MLADICSSSNNYFTIFTRSWCEVVVCLAHANHTKLASTSHINHPVSERCVCTRTWMCFIIDEAAFKTLTSLSFMSQTRRRGKVVGFYHQESLHISSVCVRVCVRGEACVLGNTEGKRANTQELWSGLSNNKNTGVEMP